MWLHLSNILYTVWIVQMGNAGNGNGKLFILNNKQNSTNGVQNGRFMPKKKRGGETYGGQWGKESSIGNGIYSCNLQHCIVRDPIITENKTLVFLAIKSSWLLSVWMIDCIYRCTEHQYQKWKPMLKWKKYWFHNLATRAHQNWLQRLKISKPFANQWVMPQSLCLSSCTVSGVNT